MRELVEKLIESLDAGQQVAYCRLVETRGSTPQKAGATMLVYPNGDQAGTLGGGCVEAEVKRQAIQVIQNGQAEVSRFQLDSDYGWDDGLICGGRMQILIEPIRGSSQYFRNLADQIEGGRGFTEAIVFDDASGLAVPSSYLFNHDGQRVDSLHADSTVPESIQSALRSLSDRPRAYAQSGVAFLPALPRCRLIIVGGGHVGKAVAELAVDLEFDVWVVDDREEYGAEDRFPRAERRIAGAIESALPGLTIDNSTYCLIVTRGHNHDEQALYHLIDRGARYIGMIGSRRKIKMIFEDLANEGVSPESLEEVYAPLGIDIGSQTVPEIAVSICAELVSHRNCNGRVPGRPDSVAVE